MKIQILLFLILFSSPNLKADAVYLYGFNLEDGAHYDYAITREQYDQQPIIDIGASEIPISPGQATRIAKNSIAGDLSPKQIAALHCGHINLVQIPDPDSSNGVRNTKRWYYNIQLQTDSGKVFMSPSFLYNQILVLMDGTAVRVKKREG